MDQDHIIFIGHLSKPFCFPTWQLPSPLYFQTLCICKDDLCLFEWTIRWKVTIPQFYHWEIIDQSWRTLKNSHHVLFNTWKIHSDCSRSVGFVYKQSHRNVVFTILVISLDRSIFTFLCGVFIYSTQMEKRWIHIIKHANWYMTSQLNTQDIALIWDISVHC